MVDTACALCRLQSGLVCVSAKLVSSLQCQLLATSLSLPHTLYSTGGGARGRSQAWACLSRHGWCLPLGERAVAALSSGGLADYASIIPPWPSFGRSTSVAVYVLLACRPVHCPAAITLHVLRCTLGRQHATCRLFAAISSHSWPWTCRTALEGCRRTAAARAPQTP